MEKVVINNDKKKNKKVIAAIISLIVAVFVISTFCLTYFLLRNHYNVNISIDPSVISAKGKEVHLDGTVTTIKRKTLNDKVNLPNSEVLLARGDVYYYNCEIENSGSGDIDFECNLLLNHSKNSIISYTFKDSEKTVYGGDSFTGSLKSGESCTLVITYEVEESAKSAFIDSGMNIVVTKGGEQ